MLQEYRTVYEGGRGEIVEKKSRFIAATAPISSEEEALAFIESVKKEYWDARHHCYAYITGERCEVQRFSDDGEPGGTAGKPILDVLTGEGLGNTAVVVTRYFGGTLLGTGGLVRAYSQAAKAGLASSKIITRIKGFKLKILTDYTGLGKIQYLLAKRHIPVLESIYTEQVELHVVIPIKEQETIQAELTEGTNGQAEIIQNGEVCFADIDGRIEILSGIRDTTKAKLQ